jgi:hypothetical protein
VFFLHLKPDHFTGAADFTYIKTAYTFNRDQFMFDKGLQGGIPVEFLPASIIKRDFYDLAGAFGVMKGEICEPIMNI